MINYYSKKEYFHDAQGFTLVEMAVVLVIVGLLLGGLLVPLSAQRDVRDYSQTRIQLERIRESLYGYAIINGQFPCPTTTLDPMDNTNYGHADASCPLTASQGYLPWKDLGVFETDAWGSSRNQATDSMAGHWIYRVDPAFSTQFTLSTTPAGNIDIHKSDGTSLTITAERAVAVVCTMGKNLVGDGENNISSYEIANPVYQDDTLSPSFDDICVWITRPSLFSRMVAAGKLPQ